ncbi:MAG: hypothetical protein WCB15_21175 [Desulfobacterales bacterium]
MKILSAHRLPDMTADYARSARERGLEVITVVRVWRRTWPVP